MKDLIVLDCDGVLNIVLEQSCVQSYMENLEKWINEKKNTDFIIVTNRPTMVKDFLGIPCYCVPCYKKYVVINGLLKEYNQITFYDDQDHNFVKVDRSVKCILVDPTIGIKF